MKHLLNTLYILSEDIYLSLDGENVVANREKQIVARIWGESHGNAVLRRTQYRVADDSAQCCQISCAMIFGKLFNARWSVERTRRDHGLRVDSGKLAFASQQIYGLLDQVKTVTSPEGLRGLEGVGAAAYFGAFDEMILGDKETFFFRGRSGGQRVQSSVFECLLDAAQCRSLQAKLCKIMDPEKDSLRF